MWVNSGLKMFTLESADYWDLDMSHLISFTFASSHSGV